MTRLFLCAIFLVFFQSLAAGQGRIALCGFDESQRVVVCEQDSRSVFRYEIVYPDIELLSKLASADVTAPTGADRERCRTAVEQFRAQRVENKFNVSIEGLRLQAEAVRLASEDNLILYKQIILVYEALIGRYKNCVQAYQDVVKTCRVTPYEVRPNRI